MANRYEVSYVLHDGEVRSFSTHPALGEAQRAAASLCRMRARTGRRAGPVLVTDLENPERGDLSDVNIEEDRA